MQLRDRSVAALSADDDLEWAERSEYWRTYAPKRRGPPKKFKVREPLVLSGHGIRIRVDHNTLLVRTGLTHYPQKADEIRYFPGEANLPNRIVVLDGSGGASFDALRWMSEQKIEFVQLDWKGQAISVAGNSGYSASPKLVEAQRATKSSRRNLEIANWLIEEKLRASLVTLNSAVPNSELREFAICRIEKRISEIRNSKNPISISGLFGIEGDCARAYFTAWQGIPMRWKGISRNPIPADWHFVGSRLMSWRKRARLARHPMNAMLNYGYGFLGHKIRSQIAAFGLDPTIGVIHGNSENPMPLVYDLMEPLRPVVDEVVLQFATEHTFAPGDFTISNLGACRLNPQLASLIVRKLATPDESLSALAQNCWARWNKSGWFPFERLCHRRLSNSANHTLL
jgi:CRISPR-associated endonuclease Cas1